MTELILNGKRVLCVKVPRDAHDWYFYPSHKDPKQTLINFENGYNRDCIFLDVRYSKIIGTIGVLNAISEETARELMHSESEGTVIGFYSWDDKVGDLKVNVYEHYYTDKLIKTIKDNGITWTESETILIIEIK